MELGISLAAQPSVLASPCHLLLSPCLFLPLSFSDTCSFRVLLLPAYQGEFRYVMYFKMLLLTFENISFYSFLKTKK